MAERQDESRLHRTDALDWRDVMVGSAGILVLLAFIVIVDGELGVALGVVAFIAIGILVVCVLASLALFSVRRGFRWGLRWTLGLLGELVLFPLHALL